VRLVSSVPDDTNAVVQCDPTVPAVGRALGGGLATDPDSTLTPHDSVIELSAPVDAGGNRAAAGERATGWVGRMDPPGTPASATVTVYVVCAVPAPPP
jgi:hypothetical protein